MGQKGEHREIQKPAALKRGKHCPFVTDPLDECFITGLSSQDVDMAIYYCGGNFEECKIYRKRMKREPP